MDQNFKVGETVTIPFITQAGTQYRYFLAHLTGGAVLTEESVENVEQPGGKATQTFTFKFLRQGKVEIQFAHYHNDEEVLYEDILTYEVGDSWETASKESSILSTLMGKRVKNEANGCYYFLQHDEHSNDKKRMFIPNPTTMNRIFTSWKAEVLPAELINLIPEMEMMDAHNAGIYKGDKSGVVFFCTGIKRYWVSSYPLLDAIGSSKSKIIIKCEDDIYKEFPIDAGQLLCG